MYPRTEFQKNVALHSWAPNLLWSLGAGILFRGLESWDSVSDQSRLVILLTRTMIMDVFWNSFAYFLPSITATYSFFILHSCSAVIKFRCLCSHNKAPNLMTWAPKPHTVPGPPILHFNHWISERQNCKIKPQSTKSVTVFPLPVYPFSSTTDWQAPLVPAPTDSPAPPCPSLAVETNTMCTNIRTRFVWVT